MFGLAVIQYGQDPDGAAVRQFADQRLFWLAASACRTLWRRATISRYTRLALTSHSSHRYSGAVGKWSTMRYASRGPSQEGLRAGICKQHVLIIIVAETYTVRFRIGERGTCALRLPALDNALHPLISPRLPIGCSGPSLYKVICVRLWKSRCRTTTPWQ